MARGPCPGADNCAGHLQGRVTARELRRRALDGTDIKIERVGGHAVKEQVLEADKIGKVGAAVGADTFGGQTAEQIIAAARRGGPAGPAGPEGPAGTAVTYATITDAGDVAADKSQNIIQSNIDVATQLRRGRSASRSAVPPKKRDGRRTADIRRRTA